MSSNSSMTEAFDYPRPFVSTMAFSSSFFLDPSFRHQPKWTWFSTQWTRFSWCLVGNEAVYASQPHGVFLAMETMKVASRKYLPGNSASHAGIGKVKNLSFSFPLHFQLVLCNSSVAKKQEDLVIPTHYSRNKASLTCFYLSHTPNSSKTISVSAPPSCLWGCLPKQ